MFRVREPKKNIAGVEFITESVIQILSFYEQEAPSGASDHLAETSAKPPSTIPFGCANHFLMLFWVCRSVTERLVRLGIVGTT